MKPYDINPEYIPSNAAYLNGNPKDAIGATKIPLGLVPATALAYQALAHYEGKGKYGGWNWRAIFHVRTNSDWS